MSKHLVRALEEVDRSILAVGSMVEEQLSKATLALVNRRADLATEAINGDDAIDRREVEFEEECLRILALHQPVAADLRFLIAVLKVNSDLERMGDLAANIAERALYLASNPPLNADLDFNAMAQRVRNMVRNVLDALVNVDADLARSVCREDDEVDKLNHHNHEVLFELMRKDPASVDRAVQTLFATRHLERLADHAVNIAEDVIYLAEGDVIRHSDFLTMHAEDESRANGTRLPG
jgi:phosphate transport system protein